MTLQALTLTTFAALGLVGFVVSQLQRRARRRSVGSDPDRLSLTFQTSTAKAKQGWAAFWARDPFVQAQRERTGMAFGI